MGHCLTCVPVLLATIAFLPQSGQVVVGGTPDTPQTASKPNPRSHPTAKRDMRVTPEREAAALTFARHNAPELVELLDFLRGHRPRQYRRAVTDLFRTSERLATIQERAPERYALELRTWKAKSRIELLVARLQVNDSDKLHGQLRDAVKTLMAAQHDLLVRERARLQDRLQKLDDQIEQWNPDNENAVRHQTQVLLERRNKGSRKANK